MSDYRIVAKIHYAIIVIAAVMSILFPSLTDILTMIFVNVILFRLISIDVKILEREKEKD